MSPFQVLENFNSLYYSQTSHPPHGNFLIIYFLTTVIFFPSWVQFTDLYDGYQIEIRRKINFYFFATNANITFNYE